MDNIIKKLRDIVDEIKSMETNDPYLLALPEDIETLIGHYDPRNRAATEAKRMKQKRLDKEIEELLKM